MEEKKEIFESFEIDEKKDNNKKRKNSKHNFNQIFKYFLLFFITIFSIIFIIKIISYFNIVKNELVYEKINKKDYEMISPNSNTGLNFILLLNGDFDQKYDINFFQKYNIIICIDGGYNNFLKLDLGIQPDYIIGDLDSIKNLDTKNYNKSKIIFKDNQDELDTEFAINFILRTYKDQKINNIDFIYTISSSRIDHVLSNLLLLKKIPLLINSKIISIYQEYFLCRDECYIKGKIGKTVSIIPLTNVKGLNVRGFQWEIDNKDFEFGFVGGMSNIVIKDETMVSMVSGECLIIISENPL